MNKLRFNGTGVVLGVALIGILVLGASNTLGKSEPASAKRATWHYKLVGTATGGEMEKSFNELGAKGWEYAGVVKHGEWDYVVFKQPSR